MTETFKPGPKIRYSIVELGKWRQRVDIAKEFRPLLEKYIIPAHDLKMELYKHSMKNFYYPRRDLDTLFNPALYLKYVEEVETRKYIFGLIKIFLLHGHKNAKKSLTLYYACQGYSYEDSLGAIYFKYTSEKISEQEFLERITKESEIMDIDDIRYDERLY